jgi:hypothetical protein
MDLLSSALSRSDTPLGLTVADGRTQDLVGGNVLPSLVKDPAAYLIEYSDGLRATMLMLDGAVKDFNFACLVSKIEQMFVSGEAPYPIERTLLTSGILESCLDSKKQNGQRLNTPHLDVPYRPAAGSQYCRI